MPKHYGVGLSLGGLAARLYESLECQEQEKSILVGFKEGVALTDASISCLYSVVRRRPAPEQLQILFLVDFQRMLAGWLYQDEVAAGGWERAVSARSRQQMVELVDVIVSAAVEAAEAMAEVLAVSQRILTCLYAMVERTDSALLRATYLHCISKLFRLRPDLFNIAIYAEMLANSDEKVEEFYEFMDYCLLQHQAPQWNIVQLILEGFSRRMARFAQQGALSKTDRRTVLKAYLKLLDHLRTQTHTALPECLLREHPSILECLLGFVSREFNHHELARALNLLVAGYMESRVARVDRFQFVLSVFKHVLLRSASLFGFLRTEPLSSEDFLEWFFSSEVTWERAKEAQECYLKNASSVEFLLVMAIYYLSVFPQRVGELKSLMAALGLLEEAKCYLHLDVLKEYFRIYFMQVGDGEYFDDFLSRVEDNSHLLFYDRR